MTSQIFIATVDHTGEFTTPFTVAEGAPLMVGERRRLG